MQSESLCKRPAKGQHGIEFFFFQIFFKIPPGIANIFDHCVILWGRMNPHSSMPHLSLSLAHIHRFHNTMPANLHGKTSLWVIHRLTIQIPTYAVLPLFHCVFRNGLFPNSCTRPSTVFRSHSHLM